MSDTLLGKSTLLKKRPRTVAISDVAVANNRNNKAEELGKTTLF